MKKLYLIGIALMVLAGLFTSCNNRIEPEGPDTPVEEEYVQVRFTTADDPATTAATRAVWDDTNGSGNLMFKWEEDLLAKELVVAISNDDMFLNSIDEMAEASNWYSYVTIEPEESTDGTPNRANFVTFNRYLSSEIEYATRIFAVAPITGDNSVFAEGYDFSAYLEMPNEFTQTASQNPEFLRDYMMMYGIGDMQNSTASIYFNHIPATFRFIITNKRPGSAAIQSITMKVDDDVTPIGSAQVEVSAMADSPSMDLSYTDEHNTITTHINADVTKGGVYTAYAMALPLPSNSSEDLSCDAFRGKNIQFSIVTAENEHLAFTLSGDQIASANFKYWDDIYNWVGGKSYTIRMKLDDILYFESVTVTDWTQEEIEGGEAEEDEEDEGDEEDEWPNGINIYTGEYQPATLNAEGAYEIANAGNLMWMSEQIGARTIGIPYTIKLVEDVTIGEDLKWIPIAHPDGTGNASVFDGNGHMLIINQNCQDASESNFGIYASFNYSVIKNLTIKGDVVINTPSAVGVVAGTAYRTTISCVTSYANITNLGNGRVGGLVGQFGGQHSGDKYSLIENCAVYANISGTIAGGIIGYGWAGWQYYDIKNSAFYGDVTGTTHQGAIIGYHANNQTATQCTFKHIYYYEKDALGFSGGGNTNYTLGADVAAKTPAEFASVMMAELLNADQEDGPWEYVTGNDYPTLKK